MSNVRVTTKFTGDEYARKLARHLDSNLDRAAISLTNAVKKSMPGSGLAGGRSGASKADRAANRSTTPNPPHRDTGHLVRNISYDKGGAEQLQRGRRVRRVGTGIGNKESVNYALALELGRRDGTIEERPYLRPMLRTMQSAITNMIRRPFKG